MVVLVRLNDPDVAGRQGLISVVDMHDSSALYHQEDLAAGMNVAPLVSVRDATRRLEADSALGHELTRCDSSEDMPCL